MKIFLTGGTGFVGSHFINAAHGAGHTLVALRRPGSLPRVSLHAEPTWIDGPLDGDYERMMLGCDTFVHLASHTPNPPYAPLSECLYWNVQASVALAEQARQAGVGKFLIAGSCFEYGRAASRYDSIPVDAPLLPTVSYPTSKAAASVAFIGFATQHLLDLEIARIFQVFGPGELETRLWPSLKKAAQSGSDFATTEGAQVRDFIHVEQVAAMLLDRLSKRGVAGEPCISHIGTGRATTLREFIEHWWKEFDGTGTIDFGAVPYRPNEMMRIVPEICSDD